MNNIKILAYCLINDNAQNVRTEYDVSSSTLSNVTFPSSLKFSLLKVLSACFRAGCHRTHITSISTKI